MFGIKAMMTGEKDLAPVREITTQTKEASALLTRVFDRNGHGEEHGNAEDKDILRIKEINRLCNLTVRQTAERLKHSLAPSFDREDIYGLVLGMTAVVHQVEMLATSLKRYQLRHFTREMTGLADRIRLIVLELDQLVPMITQPTELQKRLRVIEGVQKESQDVSHDAIGKLFRSGMAATDALMYKDLYDRLHSILERCQSAASLIERISIKQA